jgi:hypothetical protein
MVVVVVIVVVIIHKNTLWDTVRGTATCIDRDESLSIA